MDSPRIRGRKKKVARGTACIEVRELPAESLEQQQELPGVMMLPLTQNKTSETTAFIQDRDWDLDQVQGLFPVPV